MTPTARTEENAEPAAETDEQLEEETAEQLEEETETAETIDGDDGDDTPPPLAFEGRCEAVTTAGGNAFQCALDAGHEGPHAFQPVELADPEGVPVEPEPANREQLVEAQARKLDRATDAYSKKVVEVLGADLSGFETCPLCEPYYPGLRLPVPLDAELASTLRVMLGMPARANFVQDRYSKTCDDCMGLGKVLTGSSVEQYATVTCLGCKGRGWVPVGDERRVTHVADEPEGHREQLEETEPQPDADPWGRPKGDPDYGRLPGYTA